MITIRREQKPLVQQRDNPGISRRSDQAAGGLDDAGHSRNHEGVLEAAFEALVVVALQKLLLETDSRQTGADDRHGFEHVARIVHSFGEDPSGHGHE